MLLHKLLGVAVLIGIASCDIMDNQNVGGEATEPAAPEFKAQYLEFEDEYGVERARFISAGPDGNQLFLPPEAMQGVRSQIPDDEMQARAAERRQTGVPQVNVVSERAHNTEIVLAEARGGAPDQPMSLVVLLDEPAGPAFDFTRFQRLEEEPSFGNDNFKDVSNAIVVEREDSLRPSQTAFIEAAERLGATDLSPFWIINGVSLTIPARNTEALAHVPGVAGLTPTRGVRKAGHDPNLELGYDAQETIDGMRMRDIKNNGFDGLSGGRLGGRIIVAVVEPEVVAWGVNCLDWNHPAFMDWVNGPSRITGLRLCTAGGCAVDFCLSDVEWFDRHGTEITGIIAGDSVAQNQTWFVHNAYIRYYRGQESGGVARAFQQAVADGADVINYSGYFSDDPLHDISCDMLQDVSGINGILRNALAGGVVTIVAAGGGSEDGSVTCQASYPATRPETLNAPALNPDCIHDIPGPSPAYDLLTILDWGMRGGGTITVNGFAHTDEVKIFDLSTPGIYATNIPEPGDVWLTNYCGVGVVSYSAAMLSGAVALMRQTYAWVGPGWNTSRVVTGDAMLQADGWDWDTNNVRSRGGSNKSGYGRSKFHMPGPQDSHLISPWGWGGSSFNIAQGQTVCHTVGSSAAESPNVTQLTASMMWFPTDYGNAADIVFKIHDDCQGCAGANPPLVESDMGWDNSKRVRLTQAQIGGKCLVMKTHAYFVPGGGTVAVERGDRWSSGNPNDF